MPTYQYACATCDHRFDVVQSFTEDSLTVCPECAGRLRKVLSSVGVVFKGSGFYRNDSRKPERVNGSSAKDGAADKNGSKDSASTDSGSKDSGSKDSGSKVPANTGSSGSGKGSTASAGAGSKATSSSTGSGSAA